MSESAESRWIDVWQAAGRELEEQRQRELAALSPERALFLSETALSLAREEDLAVRRRGSSGLVELQRLLSRLRRP